MARRYPCFGMGCSWQLVETCKSARCNYEIAGPKIQPAKCSRLHALERPLFGSETDSDKSDVKFQMPSYAQAVLGAIDATVEIAIKDTFEVTGFPTLIFFQGSAAKHTKYVRAAARTVRFGNREL
jgi:hypothetical protein